jgi:hypothetical protein
MQRSPADSTALPCPSPHGIHAIATGPTTLTGMSASSVSTTRISILSSTFAHLTTAKSR